MRNCVRNSRRLAGSIFNTNQANWNQFFILPEGLDGMGVRIVHSSCVRMRTGSLVSIRMDWRRFGNPVAGSRRSRPGGRIAASGPDWSHRREDVRRTCWMRFHRMRTLGFSGWMRMLRRMRRSLLISRFRNKNENRPGSRNCTWNRKWFLVIRFLVIRFLVIRFVIRNCWRNVIRFIIRFMIRFVIRN